MQYILSIVGQALHHASNFFLFLILLCLTNYSKGQISNTTGGNNVNFSDTKIITDTTKKVQTLTDDRINIYYTIENDTTRFKPDTTISSIHLNPLWQFGMLNLGNEYTPVNLTVYKPLISNIQPHQGFTSFRYLLWNTSEAKLYNTTRPFTELFYTIGAKQEQQLKLTHTQNILPQWNVSAEYRKMSSPGFYKQQKNNIDNALFNTHYTSINQQYDVAFTLAYNKVQQDENGGLQNTEHLKEAIYADRRLIPVRFEASNAQRNKSSVSNYYRGAELILSHSYRIGKKDSVWKADSTGKYYRFKPRFSIHHVMQYSNEYHRFKDIQPDAEDYRGLVPVGFSFKDSVQIRYFLARYTNSISLSGFRQMGKHTVATEAGVGIDYDIVQNHVFRQKYLNNYIFATLKKEVSPDTKWWLYAAFKNYFSGYALGNSSLNATLGFKLPKQLHASICLHQMVQSPTYMQQYWGNEHFQQQNSFSKTSITHLKATTESVRQTWQVAADYFLIVNHIYRDTLTTLRQYHKVIPIAQLHARHNLRMRHWRLRPLLCFQYIPNDAPIHLPMLISNTQLAYERLLFKEKLQISTGIDLYYHSRFRADLYMPVFNGFATQYNRSVGYFPALAAFFNFKVKRFRAFITAGQIQQLIVHNNIHYHDYASPNVGLRFGFYWGFVN